MRVALRNGAIYFVGALLLYFLTPVVAGLVFDHVSGTLGGAIGHFGALAFFIIHLPAGAAVALLSHLFSLDLARDQNHVFAILMAAINAVIVFGLTYIHRRWK